MRKDTPSTYLQLPDNRNASVTNMAEYLASEVTEGHSLSTRCRNITLGLGPK